MSESAKHYEELIRDAMPRTLWLFAYAGKEGRRMEFGLGLCGWRVGITGNVAKDA